MKKLIALFSSLFLFLNISWAQHDSIAYDSLSKAINNARLQYTYMLSKISDTTKFPRTIYADSSLKLVSVGDWTTGFFPGSLWLLYEYSGDDLWRTAARKWTNSLKNEQNHTGDHDIGFIMNTSFGNGYRLSRKASYFPVLMQSGRSLQTRFSPIVGCTKSWSWFKPFPVIIDNMLNLELFFNAYGLSNDTSFYTMAISHAIKTKQNHIRPDSSTFHVVDYDVDSGYVKWQGTKQGYSDSSTWSRGQAWGIYGYTMMFNYTHDTLYLNTAKKLLAYYMKNLPADNIPYWDFNAPNIPNEPRDVSAAAITASALIDIFTFTSDTIFLRFAEKLLQTLASSVYTAKVGQNSGFILRHSTGGYNYYVDLPVNYADYYYLEALIRYFKIRSDFSFANHRPEIITESLPVVYKNKACELHLAFFDYDGDSLSSSITGLPSGLYYDSQGTISGMPAVSGNFLITLTLSDGMLNRQVVYQLKIDLALFEADLKGFKTMPCFPNPFIDYVLIPYTINSPLLFNAMGESINFISQHSEGYTRVIVNKELPIGSYIIQSGNTYCKCMKQ